MGVPGRIAQRMQGVQDHALRLAVHASPTVNNLGKVRCDLLLHRLALKPCASYISRETEATAVEDISHRQQLEGTHRLA